MIAASNPPQALGRRIFMVLAALAVAIRVMVPAGFMTSPAPTNDLPFALVMCTGQGPMVVDPGGALAHHADDKGHTDAVDHGGPCGFAGHGVDTPTPDALNAVKVAFVAYQVALAPPMTDLAPGRGLAAPPLPARGPPSLLI